MEESGKPKESVGPLGIVLVLGGAVLFGVVALKLGSGSGSSSPAPSVAAASAPGDGAATITKRCLGFDSLETNESSGVAARTGEREAFAAIVRDHGVHLEPGTSVTVIGTDKHVRRVEVGGARWWVPTDCLSR